MKRILALIFTVFFVFSLSGCKNNDNDLSSRIEWVEKQNSKIEYEKGIYHNKDWDSFEYPMDKVCVPDEETAIAVAEAVFAKYRKNNEYSKFIPKRVFFDTEDEIWIVSFDDPYEIDDEGHIFEYVGLYFNIAIKKENAEIVKMWLE